MKDEDLEKLSLDSLEEDDFMLNTGETTRKKADKNVEFLDEDFIIDTPSEKDFDDTIEVAEEVHPIIKEVQKKEEIKKGITTREKKYKKHNKNNKKEKKSKTKKKQSKKVFIIELIFCTCSILFIIGCFIFYGSRLIKYYKIYNPKSEGGEAIKLLGPSLTLNAAYKTEGDGLYRISGASIYKGVNVDNYLMFSNQMWRIISINPDGTLDLILDSYINSLSFNDKDVSFKESDINKYLNNKYLNILNKDYLSNVSYCLDDVDDITKITCSESNSENYVRLISIPEFINSKVNGKTYLESEYGYWTYNFGKKGAWHTNGTNISIDLEKNDHLVKPVIRIKNSVQLLAGSGKKEDPYIIEKGNKNLEVGKYIKLGADTWMIYEVDEKTISLSLKETLKSVYKFSTGSSKYNPKSVGSVALYLNTTYYESLPYKDKLNENTWYIGSYNGKFEDVKSDKVTAKVGMYNVADLKIGSESDMFYLLTPVDKSNTYFYNSGLFKSKSSLARKIKPTININKSSVESGKGTITDPYILGE